jgi:hypothetical protein
MEKLDVFSIDAVLSSFDSKSNSFKFALVWRYK